MTRTADFLRLRREACRLDPKWALVELDDATGFLRDRGLLTLTPCCSLPSLFGACHEEPYSPGKRGFGQYPKTRWWWGAALSAEPSVTVTKLHRGKTLYLSPTVAELVDPLCRAELALAVSGAYGDEAARIVTHLEHAGPSLTEDLKVELDLGAKDYQRARRVLEGCGAVISRSVAVETKAGGHSHASFVSRWDQVFRERAKPDDIDQVDEALLMAVVRAAVLIPEREARRALKWTIPSEVVERCLDDGLIVRVSDELVGVPID